MGEDGRVAGDPTGVLTTSGGSSYVSLVAVTPVAEPAAPVVEPAAAPTAVLAPVSPLPQPLPHASERRRPRYLGWLALVAAAVAALVTGVGVVVASSGGFVTGTVLAWAAIVLSSVAVLTGILAVVAGFGRLPGAIAVALGLLANPFLLARLLEAAAAAST